jgi:hypothetical protein
VEPPPDAGADRPVITDLPQICTAERWCWTNPLPTGDRFVQALAVGADDTWLIGASGAIVRRNGGVWSTVAPVPAEALSAWTGGGENIWVGTIEHAYRWFGGSWQLIGIPASPGQRAVHAVWGCSPSNVWLVGPRANMWDGTQVVYRDMPLGSETFRALWGSGCNEVWAGGISDLSGAGRIMRWTGSGAWTDVATQPVEQMAGTGPGDVWSLAQGQLHRWTAPGVGAPAASRILNLFQVGPDAIGTMNDGRSISVVTRAGATTLPAPAPTGVSTLSARAAGDIWGVGPSGFAAHWNGEAWSPELPASTVTRGNVVKVTGSGPADVWAVVEGGTLLHGDGSTWRIALTPDQIGGRINDVWARTPGDVWVVGGDGVVHRLQNGVWSVENPAPGSMLEMRAISGTGPKDVWILRGESLLLHWDGMNWLGRYSDLQRPVDIFAAAPDDLWVAGDDGIRRWYGGYWRKPDLPIALGNAPSFSAVAGSGPGDVWVLATGGYVLRASDDGSELVTMLNSSSRAASLAPIATGGVWVLFQDGSAASRFNLITASGPANDGRAMLGPAGLNDIWIAADGTMWAGGAGGALVRRAAAP